MEGGGIERQTQLVELEHIEMLFELTSLSFFLWIDLAFNPEEKRWSSLTAD